MRVALLTLGMLVSITVWGLAVYTDGAVASNAAIDGYGVSAAQTE